MSAGATFKTRNSSIDFIRVISVVFVVVSHTLNALAGQGMSLGFWVYGTGTIGAWGVSLFIILSGYLAYLKIYSAGTKEFYLSKITGIFPVYWVTYLSMGLLTYSLSVLGFQAFTQFETLVTTDKIDWLGVVFTVFGLDWFLIGAKWNVWIYPVVGEWYIGFIIIMFAVTPIIFKFIKVFDYTALLVATFISYASYVLYKDYAVEWVALNKYEVYWNPNFRLLEFVFGMCLPIALNKISKGYNRYIYLGYGIISVYVFIYFLGGVNLMSTMTPMSAPFGCSLSLVIIHLFGVLRLNAFSRQLRFFSKYAFIVMLVQHIVIKFTARNIDIGVLTSSKIILIFTLNLLVSYVLAMAILPIATRLSLLMRNTFSKFGAQKPILETSIRRSL